MKSNARCWTPPAAVLLIAMLWLSACSMGGSDRLGQVCPPLVEYSVADQTLAAIEVSGLPEEAMVVRMLSDYAVLRNQVLACS